MKKIFLILSIITYSIISFSQNVYITKKAKIDFFSSTLIEDIKAVNSDVISIIKTKTGEVSFGVSIKSFVFENSLMQEHFNENYMESDKFPNAKFKGFINKTSIIDFKKDGIYPALVKGTLTIHGVSKEIEVKSIITVKAEFISAKSFLKIKLEDYKIDIPSIVKNQIAKVLDVNINGEYSLYVK